MDSGSGSSRFDGSLIDPAPSLALVGDSPSGVTPEPEPDPLPFGYAALGPFQTDRQMGEAALVLRSMSIEHRTIYLPRFLTRQGGLHILVRRADAPRAMRVLKQYEDENKNWPPPRRRERERYAGFPFVIAAFVALVLFAWVTGPSRSGSRFFVEGSSVASLVLTSEPFRAVTALTLHGDGAHVMGNLMSGALFGRAVERRLGPGVGGLGLVVAGAFGNYANAAYYGLYRHAEHASIGASTAVLGAVGVLASTELLMKREGPPRRWYDIAAPIAGGLALLGTIGSSPDSDLGAHGFGLAAGVLFGVVAALIIRKRKLGWITQAVSGTLALAVIGGSWALALR